MAPQSEEARYPLQLCEVLEGELEALVPEEWERGPAAQGCWDFTGGQIRREALPGLLARLRRPGDKVCARLRRRLSPEFCALLECLGRADEPAAEELRNALATELNRLLPCEDLHRDLAGACRSDRIPLSAEMELLVKDPPADRRRVNRLLLEEALPGAFDAIMDLRLAAVYQRVHRRELAALCLSGGGIRSAIFSLGVLQGLARRGLLHRFDSLSTVSGGGYLGGLLSAWIHRHPRGLDGVSDDLAGKSQPSSKLESEPGPLIYLRSFSNYLKPRAGLLSADTWTLASILVRNLYLHWLVSIPLLLALLALPRLYVAVLRAVPQVGPLGTPWWTSQQAWLLPDGLFVLGSLLVTVALAYTGWCLPSGGGRSSVRGFLLLCLLPLTLSEVAFTIYWAWYQGLGRPFPGWWWFILPAILINFNGWSVHAMPALLRGRVPPLAKLREVPLLVITGTLGGLVPLVAASTVFRQPADHDILPWYAVFAVPTLLGVFVLGDTLFAGLASRWTQDEDREWWSRSAAWLLIATAAWIVVAGVVIYGPVLLAHQRKILTPLGGLAGLATALLARSSLTLGAADKGKTDKEDLWARLTNLGLAFAAPIFVVILMSALSLAMSWLLSSGRGFPSLDAKDLSDRIGDWHLEVIRSASVSSVARLLLGALGIGLFMALLIDINKFSLHSMYRNRLIRTFLGASRQNRNPNPFTGFDAEDNLEIWRLREPLFLRRQNLAAGAARLCRRLQEGAPSSLEQILGQHLSAETRRALAEYVPPVPPPAVLVDGLTEDFNRLIRDRFDDGLLRALAASQEEILGLRRAPSDDERFRRQRDLLLRAFKKEIDVSIPPKPLHVVNVALNLVGGKKLAWQQRKAQPFTFSPLHCGAHRLGYRAAASYGRGGLGRRAVSLGTALAISGAAASRNLGYHSSPAITFLMTFFNARLGWWLGNPGAAGARTFGHSRPTLAIGPLISETLGLTDDRNPYVHLSDGGHFDNLGLYTMVLRRCRRIVVVDAGQDLECRFEDLGNAIRKIRIDLGIHIELKKMPVQAEAGDASRYCAVGTIHYVEVDGEGAQDGELLYLKPVVCGGEPRDILHYKALSKTFPHESSGGGFTDSQFESYRMLGAHAIRTICESREGEGTLDLQTLFECARAHLEPDSETLPEA